MLDFMKDDFFNKLISNIKKMDYIRPEDIPNIDLYMDQVTTYMDNHLKSSRRNRDDKMLTKTMINNYTKNDLLPAPNKKKYSKEHMLLLIFIYYFKNILSITDIQNILNPLTEKYYNTGDNINLEQIYNEVFSLEKEQIDVLTKDVMKKYNRSQTTFEDAPEEDRDFLTTFSFICMLSFDVYMKKMIIEKLIDMSGVKDVQKMKKKKEESASAKAKTEAQKKEKTE